MRNFDIASLSVHGPRKLNEDSLLTCVQYDRKGNEIVIAVVADGLGGYQAGDVASYYVTAEVKRWVSQMQHELFHDEFDAEHVAEQLRQLFFALNDQLLRYMQQQSQKLGTTCSLLLLYQGDFIVVHVGDSRIYRFQKEGILQHTIVQQLTEDHAWVQTEIAEGRLTKEQARIHNRRNVLLQCIGIEEVLLPQTVIGTYTANDSFLLCTDGVHEVLEEGRLFEHLLASCQQGGSQKSLGQWFQVWTPLLQDNATAILLVACTKTNWSVLIKQKVRSLLKK